jgi:phosphatidylserine/phosphatidylglycerophosphate/cardiolipin synthase-like enzyme
MQPLINALIMLAVFLCGPAYAQDYTGTGDVQSQIETLITPYDAQYVEDAIIGMVNAARYKIRVFAYGFTDKKLCDTLVYQHHQGLDVAVIMDSTEAAGKSQAPLVQELQENGIPLFIGKSPVHHALIHLKAIICDDSVVESGSFNYSNSAADQINEVDIISSPERAAKFDQAWNKLYQYLNSKNQ